MSSAQSSPSSTVSRVALVTGAGSGIGRAVALGLLRQGFAVVLAGRRAEPLAELADAARAAGQHARAVPADVRDPASVEALFAEIEKSHGRLDLLFNNAGINAPAQTIDELPIGKWQEVIDTNVTGVFLCARGAFGLMRRQQPQGGRIINNGSIAAHTPRPLAAPYTVSKHAVLGLTKALALDGREFNIACSQIDIGNALTDLSVGFTKGVRQANGQMAVEPMIDVQHVADAVCYIAGLPLSANVLNMTLMASHMPFVGRG